jgi:hypothetical protein
MDSVATTRHERPILVRWVGSSGPAFTAQGGFRVVSPKGGLVGICTRPRRTYPRAFGGALAGAQTWGRVT